jgi:hypothetical protein
VLVGQHSSSGQPVILEAFRPAPDENVFWKAAASPAALVTAQRDRSIDYLRRVMLHAAPLADSKHVAWFLASYARDAKARMAAGDLPALSAVRTALEDALGLTLEGERGDHFVRATLVQALFVHVLSAWVHWQEGLSSFPTARHLD